MIEIWIFALVATAFAPTAARAFDTTFTLVDASEKICQLNGQYDWESGSLTAAQTLTNFGMYAADLGAPVDTGTSKLYFLFGRRRSAWGRRTMLSARLRLRRRQPKPAELVLTLKSRLCPA
jgi:hypothetical protein